MRHKEGDNTASGVETLSTRGGVLVVMTLRPPLMYLNKLRFLKIWTNLLHLHALTLLKQIDIFKILGLNFRDTMADVLQM